MFGNVWLVLLLLVVEHSMAARKLTGNSGKAIFSPAQRVPLSTLGLPETFRLGSIPGRLSSGSFPGARGQRSLLNTFPFNQKELDHPQEEVQDKGINRQDDEVVEKVNEDEAKHQEDRQVHGSSLGLASRDSRQGGEDLEVGFSAVAAASPDGDGKRCIDKVQMVEETVYDEVMQCDHSYDRRCHTTYTTSYESQQEEECEENFRKTCFIEYEKTARNETVNVCREPLVNTCEGSVEVCKTVYESECWTKQEAHEVEDDVVECTTELETKCQDETSGYTTNTKCSEWPKEVCTVSKKPVTKYTPITGCTKEPREICGLSDSCTLVPGETECYDKTQTIVSDAPKEQCSLEPQRTCSHVTKLVPKLEPKEECTDVPKEVCTRSRTNPRKVKKPVVKKWCYIPTEESGLFNLHNVRKTIGDPVTEAEKDAMIEDLKAAEREFMKREVESEKAAHILPFVTVNKKTTLVATHSRLVQAFELSVVNSVQRLNISVAYEELAMAAGVSCKADDSIDCRKFYRVRRADGKCNNLKNRDWGATAIAMRRLVSPAYGEPGKRDLHSPRKVNVSPRKVSNMMHKTEGRTVEGSKGFTHMAMQFGQFLDHDITMTPEGELECCDVDRVLKKDQTAHSSLQRCFNIGVKGDEEFLKNQECYPFTRSDIFCPQKGEPREQMNGITAFIDGSNIYGSDSETSIGLRVEVTGADGKKTTGARLKTQKDGAENEHLPTRHQCKFASAGAVPTQDDLTSGDTRAVVQPGLTAIHTLFLQEHNRIVDALTVLWEGEAKTKDLSANQREDFIFQLARKLVGAELQRITYQEFLPVVLGKTALGNLAAKDTEYDQNVDPSILNEFATVAFRFGHSIIADVFQGAFTWFLRDHFFDRSITKSVFVSNFNGEPGTNWMDEMIGAANQTAPTCDLKVGNGVRNKLFANVDLNSRAGDVVARNIQRGRDHGIPGYDKLRKACGMTNLIGTEKPEEISEANWRKLMETYNNDPSQIDGFTAGLAEIVTAEDGMVGPLFACIIKKQFEKLRDGDRFFFTHERSQGPLLPGTPYPQGLPDIAKQNIQGRSLGAILCDNLDSKLIGGTDPKSKIIGQDVFKTVSETNPELDCNSIKLGSGMLDIERIFVEALSDEEDRMKKGLPSMLDPQDETSPEANIVSLRERSMQRVVQAVEKAIVADREA